MNPETDTGGMYVIAYAFVALSGAIVGFITGLVIS